MIIGNPPLARLQAIANKDYPSYHARIRATLFVFKELWPEHADYWEQKCYEAAAQCQYRPPNRNEIENLVDWVYSCEGGAERAKPIPVPDQSLIAEIAKQGNLEALRAKSGPIPSSAQEVIDGLYQDDPFLCIADSVYDVTIKRKSEWIQENLSRKQFLLPNPLRDPTTRRHDNVSEQRFFVFECDLMGDDYDRQSSMILRLNKILPLACACLSAGKSIHGYFRCQNFSQGQIDTFLEFAHRLGADPATLKPGQLARLPGGWRHDAAKEQEIIYYHA